MKNKLKEIAESFGWRFVYARRDYQNLTKALDFVADEIEGYDVGDTILFLDPLVKDASKSDSIIYSGSFMVLTKSDFDDSYSNKYEKYIEPLSEVLLNDFKNQLRCSFTIEQFKTIEVINMFDINADGLNVQFKARG